MYRNPNYSVPPYGTPLGSSSYDSDTPQASSMDDSIHFMQNSYQQNPTISSVYDPSPAMNLSDTRRSMYDLKQVDLHTPAYHTTEFPTPFRGELNSQTYTDKAYSDSTFSEHAYSHHTDDNQAFNDQAYNEPCFSFEENRVRMGDERILQSTVELGAQNSAYEKPYEHYTNFGYKEVNNGISSDLQKMEFQRMMEYQNFLQYQNMMLQRTADQKVVYGNFNQEANSKNSNMTQYTAYPNVTHPSYHLDYHNKEPLNASKMPFIQDFSSKLAREDNIAAEHLTSIHQGPMSRTSVPSPHTVGVDHPQGMGQENVITEVKRPSSVPDINQNASDIHRKSSDINQNAFDKLPEPRPKNSCILCGKQFKRLSSLKTHYLAHTGEKIYKCPWNGCIKLFNVKSNMTRHYKLHVRDLASNKLS